MSTVSQITSGLTNTRPEQSQARVRGAAEQFEALLIGQMLKSMRDSEGGWMGIGEDESSASAIEYGQEMFAQSLAASGGLGIAKLVVAGLKPDQTTEP